MKTIDTIFERHSCRCFSRYEPIDKKITRSIIEAGIHAPSGKNIQPWRFVIVDDSSIIKSISDICTYSKFIRNASSLIFVMLDTEVSYDFQKDIMAIGACMQNMLLAAQEHQLGSCWIGELNGHEEDICDFISIASNRRLMAVLAIGVEDHKVSRLMKRTSRIGVNQIIDHWY